MQRVKCFCVQQNIQQRISHKFIYFVPYIYYIYKSLNIEKNIEEGEREQKELQSRSLAMNQKHNNTMPYKSNVRYFLYINNINLDLRQKCGERENRYLFGKSFSFFFHSLSSSVTEMLCFVNCLLKVLNIFWF